MSNADLIERLRNTPNWMREAFCDWKGCVSAYDRAPFEAADALAIADKRIAELEKYGRVQDPLADRIAELERKLAVAREALKGLLEYAGIIEDRCDSADTDRAREALAQIGGEDA